jgi:hypothetical protein
LDGSAAWRHARYVRRADPRDAPEPAGLGTAYDLGVLDIGVSANLMQTVVDTIRAREPSGNDDIRTEGRSRLEASSFDPAFGVGVLYQPIEDTLFLGASYQSRRLGGRTSRSLRRTPRGPNGVTSPTRGPAAGGEYSQQRGGLNANEDVAF